MQADNTTNSDRDKRLARQRETIDKVINWLREEGMNPEDRTRLHEGANHFARIVTKNGKQTEWRNSGRRRFSCPIPKR